MDSTVAFVLVSCVAASAPLAVAGVRAFRSCGGDQSVTCPEVMEEAIVQLQATRAMVSALAGREDERLEAGSRLPEEPGRDQAGLTRAPGTPLTCRIPAPAPKTRKPPPEPWRP